MMFVYEADSRAIVMRDTGDPKIEGDTVALVAVGYEKYGPEIAARLAHPLTSLELARPPHE